MAVLSRRRARFVGEAQGDSTKAAALPGSEAEVRAALDANTPRAKRVRVSASVAAKPVEASAPAAAPANDAELTPEQRDACDVLVLRTLHDVTEHYRGHRPQIFEGFEHFVPGATHRALVRYSPLRPWPTKAALMRLHAQHLVHVVSLTITPNGGSKRHPGQPIFQPTAQGLAALSSIDDTQLARAMQTVSALLRPSQRHTLPAFRRPE